REGHRQPRRLSSAGVSELCRHHGPRSLVLQRGRRAGGRFPPRLQLPPEGGGEVGANICPRTRSTSPLWGEVELRSNSGEGLWTFERAKPLTRIASDDAT